MACFIVFRQGDWKISGNAFRTLAAGLKKELPDNLGGAELLEELTNAVDSGIYYFELTEPKDESILRALQSALDAYLTQLKLEDLQDIDEVRFTAYRTKLNELSDLIEINLRET